MRTPPRLAKWWRGAGQGSRRLAAVTIGTGIGVGLLIDGGVQRKPDGAHGEAGHHILDPNGPVCYCGARGCWEVLASGAALVRLARQAGYATSTATPTLEATPNIADRVIKSASAGDPRATRILEQIASWIGLGLVNTVAFFMPDTIAPRRRNRLPVLQPASTNHRRRTRTTPPPRTHQRFSATSRHRRRRRPHRCRPRSDCTRPQRLTSENSHRARWLYLPYTTRRQVSLAKNRSRGHDPRQERSRGAAMSDGPVMVSRAERPRHDRVDVHPRANPLPRPDSVPTCPRRLPAPRGAAGCWSGIARPGSSPARRRPARASSSNGAAVPLEARSGSRLNTSDGSY